MRRDVLPENKVYKDDGCSVAPQCLACPMPVCRYDIPGGLRAVQNVERDADILHLKDLNVPVDVIASTVGTSRRTVYRVVTEQKEVAA